MILIKKLKKLMTFSTGLLLLSAIFTACDVAWFADFDETVTEYFNSDFNFFSSTLEENKNAKVLTESYKIDEKINFNSFPYSDFDNYITGYHIAYFKYYRDTKTLDSSIPSNITLADDGSDMVLSVYVNPESYDFYAVWAPNTDTKYTVQHYFQTSTDNSYILNDELTQVKKGPTDTLTSAVALKISGYEAQSFEQVNINPDGSSCVVIYYDIVKSDTGDSGDSGKTEAGGSGETGGDSGKTDTGDSGDSGDSGKTDTGDSGETGGDSGKTDTGDSGDSGDSGKTDTDESGETEKDKSYTLDITVDISSE